MATYSPYPSSRCANAGKRQTGIEEKNCWLWWEWMAAGISGMHHIWSVVCLAEAIAVDERRAKGLLLQIIRIIFCDSWAWNSHLRLRANSHQMSTHIFHSNIASYCLLVHPTVLDISVDTVVVMLATKCHNSLCTSTTICLPWNIQSVAVNTADYSPLWRAAAQ